MPDTAPRSGATEADGADLRHVESWVFDLDNTLYPAATNLFAEIDERMRRFIEDRLQIDAAAARFLQKSYYVRYGTTLSGLMREHGVDADSFLDYVHDIDYGALAADHSLADALAALPGKRYIFTNGSVAHAEKVVGRIGLAGLFDDIFDIRAASFMPKPHRETYERFLMRCGVVGPSACMFEDLAHNLEAAHALGMTTVLVASDAAWLADEPPEKRPALPGDRHDHVHYVTEDLALFLRDAKRRQL
ncbi:MAG: pyrimidine 5'-nucleotidase [Parvularculaceae bacterium]|nr:pyrimidine 5'-nucleotidase [Parvularculaceae bacterium]